MRKDFNLTEQDYDDLFDGKVRYLVLHHDKIGYGLRPKWWEVIWWRITRPHCKSKFKYQRQFQYYYVITTLGDDNHQAWSDEDTKNFIKEKGLQNGDQVTLWTVYRSGDSKWPWSASGFEYVVLDNDWKLVGQWMGA